MVNRWSGPNDHDQQEISDQGRSQPAEDTHRPVFKRLIGETGSVLGYARLKLASWYAAEQERSNVPHIDL